MNYTMRILLYPLVLVVNIDDEVSMKCASSVKSGKSAARDHAFFVNGKGKATVLAVPSKGSYAKHLTLPPLVLF
jgi:hypothetical protein